MVGFLLALRKVQQDSKRPMLRCLLFDLVGRGPFVGNMFALRVDSPVSGSRSTGPVEFAKFPAKPFGDTVDEKRKGAGRGDAFCFS